MVEKTKQIVLLKNRKCFFKKKYSSTKNLFLLGGFPGPLAMSMALCQQILTILLINGGHALFAMRDEFKYLTKHCMLFSLVPQ